ncbi:MAG: hypothetical protein LBU77_00555, partial [Clostridiales bacterium]|nr:hypothetical protein [Clostridiales bacterium]
CVSNPSRGRLRRGYRNDADWRRVVSNPSRGKLRLQKTSSSAYHNRSQKSTANFSEIALF